MRWIAEAKRTPIRDAVERLGLTWGRGIRPCPACDASRRSRSDKRPPITVSDAGRWRCWACERGGSVVDLVSWALTGAVVDPREPGEVGEWFGLDEPARGRRRRRPSPRAEVDAQVEPERGYPPAEMVEAVWASLAMVCDAAEVAGWLESRQVDPSAVEDRDLARAVTSSSHPATARWHESGHRCALPMYDAAGALRSIRARQVEPGRDGPKTLAPSGYRAGGLVFADLPGRAMLRDGTRPTWWPDGEPFEVIVVEGGPSWLAAAAEYSVDALCVPSVLGVVAGSWTDEIAARVPDGAVVTIATDDDGAGQGYQAAIGAALYRRCGVYRGT